MRTWLTVLWRPRRAIARLLDLVDSLTAAH
jgi:hypothetical protein